MAMFVLYLKKCSLEKGGKKIFKWIRLTVQITILLLVVLVLLQMGIISVPKDASTILDEAERACLSAEMYEAGKNKTDMVLILYGVIGITKSESVTICEVFTSYRLLRAPSQGVHPWATRDADVIRFKSRWRASLRARMAQADIVLKQYLAGKDLTQGLPEPAKKFVKCELRVHRVWLFNTAGTDVTELKKWSDSTWRSSSGTTFYCHK